MGDVAAVIISRQRVGWMIWIRGWSALAGFGRFLRCSVRSSDRLATGIYG